MMFDLIPTPLISLIGFILTISFLVFIHEFGHFWAAKKFGVKIESFSVGFGKPIFQRIGKDQTDYRLSWIPLGGYVKMYEDKSRVGTQDTISQTGNFALLSPQKRFLVAFAGPAVNILFAIFALWLLFIIGVPAIKPTIGSVLPHSPLHQKIIAKDEIVAINGNKISSVTDAAMHLVDYMGQNKVRMTTRDTNHIKSTHVIDLSSLTKGSELNIIEALGFRWEVSDVYKQLPSVIAHVEKHSPAADAGMEPNDKIKQANGVPIHFWKDFVKIIHQSVDIPIDLKVQRGNKVVSLELTPRLHANIPNTGYAGIRPLISESLFDDYRIIKRLGPVDAVFKSIETNYFQAKLTLKMLFRVVTGAASVENIGGPIRIADASGQALSSGYMSFFYFLASISLIIAVMNLLPIPVLDGGHMLICIVEIIKGSSISEGMSKALLSVGMIIMLTFMMFVIILDLWRYLI